MIKTTKLSILTTTGPLSASPAVAQEVTLHMGHNTQAEHPDHLAGEMSAEQVSAATNGAIKIIVCPSEQIEEIDAPDVASFQEAMSPVWDEFTETAGPNAAAWMPRASGR